MNKKGSGDQPEEFAYFRARITLDGPNKGQVIDATDDELAAEAGISVEQLKEIRAEMLAKAYRLILSWPDPKSKKDIDAPEDEQNLENR